MVTFAEKAQVSLPSDREVLVTRKFNYPRKLVWTAYTTPELVRKWMLGYPGWTMPVCEMDVRVGGKFRWVWRLDEDGSQFGFHGEYKEVTAPEKLRNTEIFDPGDVGGTMGDNNVCMTSVTLTEQDGVTTLVTLMDFGSKEGRDAAVSTGMTDGMESSYQMLDALLAERGA